MAFYFLHFFPQQLQFPPQENSPFLLFLYKFLQIKKQTSIITAKIIILCIFIYITPIKAPIICTIPAQNQATTH